MVKKKKEAVKKEVKKVDKVFRGVPLEELRKYPRLHEPFLSRFGEKEAEKWFD